MNIKKWILVVIFCFLIFIFCILGYLIFFSGKGTNSVNSDISDIIKNSNGGNKLLFGEIIKELPDEYNSNDVAGFINFPSSAITIPLMQGSDNDYYLNHTPDGKENYVGSIFLDYRLDIEESKKLLVYGHSSKKGEFPFNFLQNYYLDKDYFLENKNIEIVTNSNKKSYEIFSVYVDTSDFSYMETDYVNDDEYLSHIEDLKNKSIYDTGIKLSSLDEILILQTCSTHDDYKDYENKYLLIIARRV